MKPPKTPRRGCSSWTLDCYVYREEICAGGMNRRRWIDIVRELNRHRTFFRIECNDWWWTGSQVLFEPNNHWLLTTVCFMSWCVLKLECYPPKGVLILLSSIYLWELNVEVSTFDQRCGDWCTMHWCITHKNILSYIKFSMQSAFEHEGRKTTLETPWYI